MCGALGAFTCELAAPATCGAVVAEAGGAGTGGVADIGDTAGMLGATLGVVGATLRALSGGGDTALIAVAGSVLLAERVKCDQVNTAPPIKNAPAPSNAKSAALELRLRVGTASSCEAERPATDWLGTAAAENREPAIGPESGPETAGAAPVVSGVLAVSGACPE